MIPRMMTSRFCVEWAAGRGGAFGWCLVRSLARCAENDAWRRASWSNIKVHCLPRIGLIVTVQGVCLISVPPEAHAETDTQPPHVMPPPDGYVQHVALAKYTIEILDLFELLLPFLL